MKYFFFRRAGLVVSAVVAMAVGVAEGGVVTDGYVGGFAEGYTSGYQVTFDIDKWSIGVPGGKLFFDETLDAIRVGLIVPLNLDDNTYGATKAADWGTKKHSLHEGKGGESLEGSDKWKFMLPVVGEPDIEVELDYIKKEGSSYVTEVTKLKQGSDLAKGQLVLHTSIDYNFNVLGFDPDDVTGYGIDSPGPAPSGVPPVYDFDAPAEDWVAEIMYEFSLEKSAYAGDFDLAAFLQSLGELHLSPNKLGGNKTHPKIDGPIPGPPPIPEPSTFIIWSLLGAFGVVFGLHRRRKRG